MRSPWLGPPMVVALVALLGAPAVLAPPARAASTAFLVGADQESITPTDLGGIYLGGYGIGPVHRARSVLRPIYTHAVAISNGKSTVVFASLDVQGHFAAYQQPGGYGFADIRRDIQQRLRVPAANIVISSTHTHNGPDDLGVWGGVPVTYLQHVKDAVETAITKAVHTKRQAVLSWATRDMTGFCGTFGGGSPTGDPADYPVDNQLRALQATNESGAVIATIVNFSCHATVYGPLDKISPDWPGSTVAYLENAEQGVTGTSGYPGSIALVMVGAVGHTWPATVPSGYKNTKVDPPSGSDNYHADAFGNGVARAAMAALASPHRTPVTDPTVKAARKTVDVVNTNPLLAGLLYAPVPGYHIDRSVQPPYTYGDVLAAETGTIRIGDLAFYSVPGEPYPSLLTALGSQVKASAHFMFGLAEDQLGYVEMLSDYNGAAQCSLDDEFFFTISPEFGHDVVALDRQAAKADGFTTTAPDPVTDNNPGPVPPATNCTQQQLGQLP